MKILLVDDHRDGALVMSKILKQKGFDVEIAGDCEGATSAFEATHFDLVIVDIVLPDGDGCDLLPMLAQMRPVTSIAISAYPLHQNFNRIRAAGFDRFLPKPISAQSVCRMIDELFPSANLAPSPGLNGAIDAWIIAWVCANKEGPLAIEAEMMPKRAEDSAGGSKRNGEIPLILSAASIRQPAFAPIAADGQCRRNIRH
jgi:CheY-like chemotaxis protein